MVPDWPQPPFRREGAEIRFDFRQAPIGLKDFIKIPVGMAGSKAARTRAKITSLCRLVVAPRYIRRLLLGVTLISSWYPTSA